MVSIIVPIYNADKYLKRCILSIINQTYRNIELLLIDDGSTDNSAKICDSFAQKDPRIKVIHTHNNGISHARNLGLRYAKGNYFSFVDADDYVDETYIEQLLNKLEQKKVDIVYCSAIIEDENNQLLGIEHPSSKVIKANNYDWCSPWAHTVVRGAIYPEKIIKNLYFDEKLYVGEDTYFFACCVKRAKKVFCLEDRLYHYIKYSKSASHGKFNSDMLTEITAREKIISLFNTINAKAACVMVCRKIVTEYYMDESFKKNYLNEVLETFNFYYTASVKYYLKHKNLKIMMTNTLFRISPMFFMILKMKEQ